MSGSRKISLAVGATGLAAGALHTYWWWKITSSPGDDNPLGMVFAACAMLAWLPAAGWLFALAKRPGESVLWKIWLAFAGPAALLVGGLAIFFALAFSGLR